RGRLRSEVGDAAYRSWLKPLTLTGVTDGEVRLSAPTRFMRDWILSHYHDRLTRLWTGEVTGIREVTVTVEQARSATQPILRPDSAGPGAGPLPVDAKPAEPVNGGHELTLDLSAPLDPRFTFENFVTGRPNELAYAAARRVAEAK